MRKKLGYAQPAWRVERALKRLSRDRWLSGEEVEQLALSLSRCCSSRPNSTAWAAAPGPYRSLGMIAGRLPCLPDDPRFPKFQRALFDRKRRGETDMSPEIDILNLTLNLKVKNVYRPAAYLW